MSDGTRKRIKLKMGMPGSKSGSPKGSRAASPTRGAASSGGSRAVSPGTFSTITLLLCRCTNSGKKMRFPRHGPLRSSRPPYHHPASPCRI